MTYARALLITLVSLATLYYGAAVVVDPRGTFQTRRFPDLVMDSRLDKVALYTDYAKRHRVDGLILGSSRSMLVSPRFLADSTGHTFFNFSVDSARAEDYLAIYNWVCTRNAPPRIVILGLDVEALHDREGYDDRLLENLPLFHALKGGKASQIPVGDRLESSWKCFKGVFSTQYVRDMVRSVRQSCQAAHQLPISTFDEDGFLRCPLWDDQIMRGTFDRQGMVAGSKKEYTGRFAGMKGLSEKRKGLVEELVASARSNGAAVEIWITTLHPEVSQALALQTSYPLRLKETRDFLSQLQMKYGVGVFDFSDPALFAGDPSGWYDGGHIDGANTDRVIGILVEDINKHGI